MRQPAAKEGDRILATDTHIVMVPVGLREVPTPLPHPFTGIINDKLSANVNIMGRAAATVGSTADNTPHHFPTPPGTRFPRPEENVAKAIANLGTIEKGSRTVRINGKAAARNGDVAMTCNDPPEGPPGKVVAVGTVFIG